MRKSGIEFVQVVIAQQVIAQAQVACIAMREDLDGANACDTCEGICNDVDTVFVGINDYNANVVREVCC